MSWVPVGQWIAEAEASRQQEQEQRQALAQQSYALLAKLIRVPPESQRQAWGGDHTTRNLAICTASATGVSHRAIGEQYGITTARVTQIVAQGNKGLASVSVNGQSSPGESLAG